MIRTAKDTLKKRVEALEAKKAHYTYPLNQLVGKVPDSDFQYVKQNLHLPYFYIDTANPRAVKVRLILERAGILPPLKFAE